MNPTVALLISLTLFCTMFALGLSLELEALQRWIRRPAFPVRVVLCSCLLVPLVGLLLLQLPWSWAIPQPERTALALMAICPSAPLALRKSHKSGGDRQLAALVQISAALCAIATVPLLAVLFRQSFSVSGWEVKPIEIALQVGRAQVVPVLLAVGLRQWRPGLANWLETPLDRLANTLLALLAGAILIKTGPLLIATLLSKLTAMLFMALLVVASLAIGWALSGDNASHRITTSLVTAMRNPGLALLLASEHGQGLPGLKAAILIYVSITLLLSWPVMQGARRIHA
jgi:BASS family bile acid:Na+ symporter